MSYSEPIPWSEPLPEHLAVILDGNGRWAEDRGKARIEGHRAGAERVRELIRTSRRLGIKHLTLYTFSIQNWDRPSTEVAALMALLLDYTRSERTEILENGIRFKCIGDLTRLPAMLRAELDELEEASRHHTEMTMSLAVSYGGREELVSASRRVAQKVQLGELSLDDVDAERLSAELWTPPSACNVDLVIRTGGELRVSNFLLWQIAYAELYFTEALWPDFRSEDLLAALRDFARRKRRFGKV